MATPSSFTFPQRYVWLKSAPLTSPAEKFCCFFIILLIFVEILETGGIFCSFSWSLSVSRCLVGAGKTQDTLFPQRQQHRARCCWWAWQAARGSLSNQDVCVPREQVAVQDCKLQGQVSPRLGTGLGGSGKTWASLLCLGVKLFTALTLSSKRDVSDEGVSWFVHKWKWWQCHRTHSLFANLFLPVPDLVDHPPEGGALGAGGVLAVCLGLRAGDDLLARGPWRQPQDRGGHRGHRPAAARPAGCWMFGGTFLFPNVLFPRTRGMLWDREGRIGWSLENLQCKNCCSFTHSKNWCQCDPDTAGNKLNYGVIEYLQGGGYPSGLLSPTSTGWSWIYLKFIIIISAKYQSL